MKKIILIIDDAKEIREMFRMALEEEGYEVLDAIHGKDAFEILSKLDSSLLPGLILLDLMMPVMDGHQFLDQLHKEPSLLHIPIVVMTAKDNPVFSSTIIPKSILRKPVMLDLLLGTVESNILDRLDS